MTVRPHPAPAHAQPARDRNIHRQPAHRRLHARPRLQPPRSPCRGLRPRRAGPERHAQHQLRRRCRRGLVSPLRLRAARAAGARGPRAQPEPRGRPSRPEGRAVRAAGGRGGGPAAVRRHRPGRPRPHQRQLPVRTGERHRSDRQPLRARPRARLQPRRLRRYAPRDRVAAGRHRSGPRPGAEYLRHARRPGGDDGLRLCRHRRADRGHPVAGE